MWPGTVRCRYLLSAVPRLQLKARYANLRPYKEWLKVNVATLADVVHTAPNAMAPQLLGVPAESTVNPSGGNGNGTAASNLASKLKAAVSGNGANGANGNGKSAMKEEDAILSILAPLKAYG